MGFGIGPSSSWMRTKEAADYYAIRCPVATTLGDGSRIFCKTGGRAWIVAPSSTEISGAWAGGQYSSTSILGDRCCICEWTSVNNRLLTCGFNPCDWFIPNISQLQSGYTCRCNWDTFCNLCYWSSTECSGNAGAACFMCFTTSTVGFSGKNNGNYIRAFRCVTY